MTNKQAIKVLENVPFKPTNEYSFNDISDAVYMAVKALEKQTRLEALIDMGAEYADRMYKEGNADD